MKSKTKLNIGIDLDGVIIDHTKNKIKAARGLGFKIFEKHTASGVLEGIMPQDAYKELQDIVYGKESLSAPPVSFAITTIRKLARAGHKLFIISRRRTDSNEAQLWLKKHNIYKYIPKNRVVFVGEDYEKAHQARKLKISLFLDDKTKVLTHLNGACLPILFNNQRADINDSEYKEVYSWKEFFNFIQAL